MQLPGSLTAWFVPIDFEVKRSEIKKLELTGGGRDAVKVAVTDDKPGEFTLQNVPENRAPETFKVSQVATLIDAFSFQDVRRRGAAAPADARHFVAETDGLRLTMTNVGELSDGWVQITAEATNDAKRAQAEAITTKTAGFEFRLPSQQTEILSWTANDLTIETDPKPPEAEPKPADPEPKPAGAEPKP